MITIATQMWDPNQSSFDFSRCYDESWVEKLYRGFARNLTQPFRLVCYSEKERVYAEPIEQRRIIGEPSYASCIQLYSLNCPTIIVGLDTIITGNVDHLAQHALDGKTLALPRDPYHPDRACNGVALVPAGQAHIAYRHNGENDMEWMRQQPHVYIDDLFPGQVVSWKCNVRGDPRLGDARIVYFHGQDKPHQISGHAVLEHWV